MTITSVKKSLKKRNWRFEAWCVVLDGGPLRPLYTNQTFILFWEIKDVGNLPNYIFTPTYSMDQVHSLLLIYPFRAL